jgi:peptidyl-tRNA hydrolase, PTH2 family
MKMVVLLRTDLGMKKGKIAAQCGHAFVSGATSLEGFSNTISLWKAEGQPKVVLKVSTEDILTALIKAALKKHLNAGFITDAGKTTFKGVATLTCGWIGPGEDYMIDEITKDLHLL